MRGLRLAALCLSGALCAGAVEAANGVVGMGWDDCSPLVTDIAPAAPGVFTLFVFEDGNDVLSHAYDVRIIYGDTDNGVPDAWRFDAAGCQGYTPLLTIEHLAPSSVIKSCPSFQGQNTSSLQIKDCTFTPPSDPYATTTMRLLLANSYFDGHTGNGGRMFLAAFRFDHGYSVAGASTPGETCGGLERSVCFKLTVAHFYDPDHVEYEFDRPAGALVTVTSNGPAACDAIPARAATWGQIKQQYR